MDERRSDVESLAARLKEATSAAENAYRDSARLTRLLTVLSSPAPPSELLERATAVLSEVFICDVVCVVECVGERFVAVSASGLPRDDVAFVEGWALGPAAAEVIASRTPVTRQLASPDADVPSSLDGLGLRSAAFVPMSTGPVEVEQLLVLFRSTGEPFSGTDLHVLTSVAQRLAVSAADRERAEAIERLAQTGHQLAGHLDPTSLDDIAAELLQRLTVSDGAWVGRIGESPPDLPDALGATPVAIGAGRHPIDAEAWAAALQGRMWTKAATTGPGPRATMCIPVVRGGAPIALLCAMRDRPSPYRGEVREIATIFADYFGTAVENARLYEELSLRATRDTLTGLANRDLVTQRLDDALATGSASRVGLLFCDLDGFKAINDRLGHEAGDELLRLVAARLRGGVRPRDLLARFGGDEFVVVLGDVDTLDQVVDVARRLLRGFDESFALHGEQVSVTASIGGVLGKQGETTANAMLRDADAAMYVAKARGRGVVEVFDEAASTCSLDRLGLRSELLHAVDRREFEIGYQPVVRLDSGTLVAFEALLRWTHPSRGPVPPDVFIPLAEEAGEIVRIGTWVLGQACRQLADWQRLPGHRRLLLSVNGSAAQLCEADSSSRIVDLVRSTGVDPKDVWIEVNERSHAGEDVTMATESLRSAGFHLAIDDFGASYSNLAYLKQFPAECLKIDRSFVDNLATDRTNQRIVRGILAIAESLGLSVVAEGVERAADKEALLSLGCRLGQGHLFAPALMVPDATDLLRASAGGS
jgi:diguanylate cyclase (GGDEF)-like protein